MTDERRNTSLDDEYQFPKDEYISSEGDHGSAEGQMHSDSVSGETPEEMRPAASGFGHWFDQLKNSSHKGKRIFLIAVVIVIVVVGFQWLNAKKAPKPVIQQPVDQSAPVVQPQPANTGLSNSLDSLAAKSAQTESAVGNLQAQVAQMQNALTEAQATNEALQKAVGVLTTQVDTLSSELKKLETKAPVVHNTQIVFHLRAVVPDRAWISSAGRTQSVTVGDYVKGYGTVTLIDAQHGIVYTNSGRKIEYGPNDF